MNMSQPELEDLVEKVAERAVLKAFRDLGVEDGDVFAMRRDFAFLRDWRETCEQVRSKGTFTLVGIIVTGMVGLLVLGFKGWLPH